MLLETRNLTKRFPGVVALKNVCFGLKAGEIHALCGENGAGKSTLIKLLSGIHPHGSYEGELLVDGKVAEFKGIRDSEAQGIAVITQEFALVDELSVAENIFLGREPRKGWRIDWLTLRKRAAELLAEFGLPISPDTLVGELGVGHKQLVEIVRAMDKKSRVLVLDEPTAALTEMTRRRGDALRRTDILDCHSGPTPGLRREGPESRRPRPGRRRPRLVGRTFLSATRV
ncbi:MAG: ATP-binding cassette domain-containing protein [Nibricoccus sp.]